MKKTIIAAVCAVAMGFVSTGSFAAVSSIGQGAGIAGITSGPGVVAGGVGNVANVNRYSLDFNGGVFSHDVSVRGGNAVAVTGTYTGSGSLGNGISGIAAGGVQQVTNKN